MANIDIDRLKKGGILFFIVFLVVFFFGVVVLQEVFDNAQTLDTTDILTSELILSNTLTSNVLIATPSIWNSATVHNQTWLDFDGVDDVLVNNRSDTISFWYKNTTTDWTFIVNSSGTLYVNGTIGTPGIYPIYDDGVNMNFGKTDATTFINVSIDDIRTYGAIIDSELVNLTFQDGRK